MERCGHDVDEKLGRELNDDEIKQLRERVDEACPRVYSATQLKLDLQPA